MFRGFSVWGFASVTRASWVLRKHKKPETPCEWAMQGCYSVCGPSERWESVVRDWCLRLLNSFQRGRDEKLGRDILSVRRLHWLGGVGVATTTMMTLKAATMPTWSLYHAELSLKFHCYRARTLILWIIQQTSSIVGNTSEGKSDEFQFLCRFHQTGCIKELQPNTVLVRICPFCLGKFLKDIKQHFTCKASEFTIPIAGAVLL